MLKTTRLPDKPALSKNDDSRPAFRKNEGNSEVNGFDVSRNGVKHIKKSEKLFKLGKSKSKKTFKSRNLAKLGKKLSKSENSTNFDAIKDGPKFPTSDDRTTFNHLQLVLTKAPIF